MNSSHLFFVAYTPEASWSDIIRSWQEEMCSQFLVCQSLNAPPHITIVPPFRSTLDQGNNIMRWIDQFNSEISVETNDVYRFGNRVIFIKVKPHEELSENRIKLISRIRDLDIEIRAGKVFHPHITLGHKIPQNVFDEAWNHFKDFQLSNTVICNGPFLFQLQNKKWNRVDQRT